MKYLQLFIPQVQKSARSRYYRFVPALVCLLSLLVLTSSGLAEISITGLQDKTVYADSVTFTVNSEEGYDYTVLLNGIAFETDVAIEVSEPEYYELYVHRQRQSSGAQESTLIQFIVRATERGSSEVGLPIWTPYPAINSAEEEFTNAQLRIVTPSQYPMGLDIPIIARVRDQLGNRLGVNGAVTAEGFEDYPLQLLRGVGSVFLPAATEPGIISYTGQIQSLQSPKQISIEASTTWQTVSEDITTSTDWPDNARIHITGVTDDLVTITSGSTLTIGAGSVIIVDPDIEITVEGNIIVNGTQEQPVIFTTEDRNNPWGGFLFETGSSEGQFTSAIFTASGADSNWFDNNPGHGSSHRREQCLFYLSKGAQVTLTDCYMIENHGQAGHGESSYLTMTGCIVQKCITTGQYNDGAVILEDCALIEFPSAAAPFADADNDALYLTGGAHSLTNCLVGWLLDDGVDSGSGGAGSTTVNNCWFESCYHEAMAWSETRDADVADTVAINCGQGIECGFGAPDVDAENCLSTANVIGVRFGDNYDWTYDGFLTVSNSLLLFNIRDVWGRAWDDWTVHLSQMDIQSNYLSAQNDNYPNNYIWNPQSDPNQQIQLEQFMTTPIGKAGIGFATLEDTFALSELSYKIPVRLSTFTTNSVSIDYIIHTDDEFYDSGTLHFVPGETVKFIEFEIASIEDNHEIRVTLSNPANADLTGYEQITYFRSYDVVEPLILEGDEWQYFKGTQEPPDDWNQLWFEDPNWLNGPTGIGYEASAGYESCIATDLPDMQNNYISVYARRLFFVEEPSRLKGLTFTMDWDDGYIAYINGIRVDSQYPPEPATYDQPATTDNHEACCGSGTPTGPCPPEEIDLTDYIDDLEQGFNVLAVQVHNTSLGSSDFLFIPQLYSVVGPIPGDFEPDGDVDSDDFAIFAKAWLTSQGHERYNPACDINFPADEFIDIYDLLVFVDNWLADF